jgi:CheY-like chemotaxis protein
VAEDKCETEERMSVPTVLVVEADPSIRTLFDDVLRSEGYQVALLEPGAVSVPQIADSSPDLLLLELAPGNAVQTLALIAEMQREPATTALPVVVSTTNPLLVEQHGAALRQLGCGTLLKPFDLDCLLSTVSQQVVAAA